MLLHHHSSRAGFILQNIEHISQEQCNDGSRDLSIQWKVEEGQQCIAFCMKAQEIMVSLPLLLCLCISAIFPLFFPASSTGWAKLKPLVPKNLEANQKKINNNNGYFIKKPNSAELHSNFMRRMKQRHPDLMQISSQKTPPRILEQ